MAETSIPVEVLCCYSHTDEKWLRKVEIHLGLLQRQGLISLWYDRLIVPGADWAKTIDTHLETASVILLLVSADFMASNYCYSIEMKRALERQEADEARVVPILLRPVDWKGAPFAHLQALPTGAKPLASWRNEDQALANVAVGIRRVIEDMPPSPGRLWNKQGPVAITDPIGGGMLGLHFEDLSAVDAEQMLKQAQRLIQEDPSPHGYGLAGMVLAAAGLHRTSTRFLLRSVQDDEDQPSTWFNLGQAYELIGETEKASEALIRALQLRRDFSKILKQRENELPKRIKEYLSGIEERYHSLLGQRSSLMEKAIVDLKGSTEKSESALITVTRYEVTRGTNLSQFIIYLEPDGTAITFCYPEELHDAEIIMPFRIPKGVDFEKHKSRIIDHFGYKEFEFNAESDKPSKSMMFFAGRLKYEKLSAAYLLRWILRSVLFQKAGEAFLENRPYWEVQIDGDEAEPGS